MEKVDEHCYLVTQVYDLGVPHPYNRDDPADLQRHLDAHRAHQRRVRDLLSQHPDFFAGKSFRSISVTHILTADATILTGDMNEVWIERGRTHKGELPVAIGIPAHLFATETGDRYRSLLDWLGAAALHSVADWAGVDGTWLEPLLAEWDGSRTTSVRQGAPGEGRCRSSVSQDRR